MNTQQMAMELQVLRGQNRVLKQSVENLSQQLKDAAAQAAGAQVFETIFCALLTGYASQSRAANDTFWKKDDATGEMVPMEGGPKWVVEQANTGMGIALELLQGTFQAEPSAHEAQVDTVAQGAEEVQQAKDGQAQSILEEGNSG